ncbi:putative membrane protein [Anaplasma phagocytophilum str. ApNP]|uniref:Putative membrane protein n=2 Tax=Anaplasma phagocytophilum TaxID=948 RepID=A0A0F3NIC7_ANAPH|nr:putative membrane protein [Anaplasma phagocytophilum str. ApMUC09]KJV67770.1 putative membrane protein [Anaplasma phagocytophilum str. ApNP]
MALGSCPSGVFIIFLADATFALVLSLADAVALGLHLPYYNSSFSS